jgi:hypothetical protein
MKFARVMLLPAAVLLTGWTMLTLMPAPSAAATRVVRSGVPPFCVAIGGPRGIPRPQVCRFYDWQECLQAAADLRGNCVVNIDYRGQPPIPGHNGWGRY